MPCFLKYVFTVRPSFHLKRHYPFESNGISRTFLLCQTPGLYVGEVANLSTTKQQNNKKKKNQNQPIARYNAACFSSSSSYPFFPLCCGVTHYLSRTSPTWLSPMENLRSHPSASPPLRNRHLQSEQVPHCVYTSLCVRPECQLGACPLVNSSIAGWERTVARGA